MPAERHLVRAALRLREIYLARAARTAEQTLTDCLVPYPPALERLRAAPRDAGAGSVGPAPLTVRRHLYGLVAVVKRAVATIRRRVEDSPASVPGLRDLVEDLRQLADEFGGLEIDLREMVLRVRTGPVVLDGVD